MSIKSKKLTSVFLSACVISGLSGCSNLFNNTSAVNHLSGELTVSPKLEKQAIPKQWINTLAQVKSVNNKLHTLADPLLQKVLLQVIKNNRQLKQQALALEIKKRQLFNAQSSFWPDISAKLSTSRRKNGAIIDSSSLSLDANYELDIWGKLSASEQQANVDYLAAQATFENTKQQLVVNTIVAWYNAVAAQQLLLLNQQRSENTKQNLAIIETGYQQGLNKSLDVYLTRNELNSALARVAQLKQNLLTAKQQLEMLMGKYPDANVLLSAKLTTLSPLSLANTPLSIVEKKPSLQANWYQLLAADAGLAFAHKQRFPRLSFSASLTDNQSKLSDLLSGSSLGWSLLGNISAPIFQAGRLKNNEEIARIQLKQAEQNYLDEVYKAFQKIEKAIAEENSLAHQSGLQQQAASNAKMAYQLSFEQYQQGLVNYSTVLDAQNRWFDAQSNVIQLQNQLITNRVNLRLALGEDLLAPNGKSNRDNQNTANAQSANEIVLKDL